MTGRRAGWLDALLLVAAVWAWGGTSAWFWNLAHRRDTVLPYVPRLTWAAPGWLWMRAPVLVVLLLAGATLLALRRPARLRAWRAPLVMLLVLVGGVAIVWGGALIAGEPPLP